MAATLATSPATIASYNWFTNGFGSITSLSLPDNDGRERDVIEPNPLVYQVYDAIVGGEVA